jgi:hypothetical protein
MGVNFPLPLGEGRGRESYRASGTESYRASGTESYRASGTESYRASGTESLHLGYFQPTCSDRTGDLYGWFLQLRLRENNGLMVT